MTADQSRKIRGWIADTTPDQLKLSFALWTARAVRALIARRLDKRLGLHVPALILSGLHDGVFFDAADAAALSTRLARAGRIELPDVGHLVSMGRPQAVVDACLALARRIG